jgi:hypothetical protein
MPYGHVIHVFFMKFAFFEAVDNCIIIDGLSGKAAAFEVDNLRWHGTVFSLCGRLWQKLVTLSPQER